MKRVLSILLALTLLFSVFALTACGNKETSATTKAPLGTGSGTKGTTTEPGIPDFNEEGAGLDVRYGFEDVDFGGYTFNFAAPIDDTDGWASYEVYAEEDGEGILDAAINQRNNVMLDNYDCFITVEAMSLGNISNDFATGKCTVDVGLYKFNNWALVDGGYEYPETLPTLVKAENPVEEPTGPQAITVAEFLALSVGTTEYELTGVIEGTYNTTYGNFYLNDGTGKVLVYGLTATPQTSNDKSFASLGLRDGDTLTLIGQRADYNGTAQVGGPAYYVSHIAAPYVDFAVGSATVDAEATTYSIEFESNVAWTATASAGVTVNPASGDGDGTVVMTFAANTSNDPIDHTVTFTATDLTKTFTLTQKGVPAEGAEPKYVKVTEEQTDWSGKYLIVFGNNAHATLSGKDLNATKAVNPVAGEIEATSDLDAAVMTVSKNGDKYVMTYPDGKYFSMAKNASSSSTTAFDLTFTYTANGVKIAGVASGTTYILYHNSTNGNYYRCYVDKNGQSGYTLPTLYKYTE